MPNEKLYDANAKIMIERTANVAAKYAYIDKIDIVNMPSGEFEDLMLVYKDELDNIIKWFYNDDNVYQYTKDHLSDFIISLKKFALTAKVKNSSARTKDAISKLLARAQKRDFYERSQARALWDGYPNPYYDTIRNLVGRQVGKLAGFNAQKAPYQLFIANIQAIGQRKFFPVTIDGVEYHGQEIRGLWQRMSDTYGNHDTVMYRDGRLMPLRTYYDMRNITTHHESARILQQELSNKLGILFLKISSQPEEVDDCRDWAGATILQSETARTIAANQYREYSNAVSRIKRMKTMAQLQKLKNHIFDYGCKHSVTPDPINYYDAEDAVGEIMTMNIGRAA